MISWTMTLIIFILAMAFALRRPRNEWLSNSVIVLLATLVANWYRPVLPELLFTTTSGVMTHPFHRMFGIFLLIAVLWSILEHWEDLKVWWKERKSPSTS